MLMFLLGLGTAVYAIGVAYSFFLLAVSGARWYLLGVPLALVWPLTWLYLGLSATWHNRHG